jgi:hypothetical protein
MHVRRGDKLHSEASYVGPKTFFDMIPPAAASLPIVIVTDDHAAFLEFANFAAANGLGARVSTTAETTDIGYDNSTFKKQSPGARSDSIKKLLADFDVLCGAKFLICSFSSNVGRMAYIVREGRDTASVDTAFSFVQ